MISFETLINFMNDNGLERWGSLVEQQNLQAFNSSSHANFPVWKEAIENLPEDMKSLPEIVDGVLAFNSNKPFSDTFRSELTDELMKLHPWRKGPVSFDSLLIDTEWRSDKKWDRLKEHITPLKDRTVLDIGCGNGYHCYRMALENAGMVIGVDPYLLNVMQFYAIRKFSENLPVYVLPVGIEDIPENTMAFDTVFSMGILYHRKSPFDHLRELRGCLRNGGELVLETLVVDSEDEDKVFIPEGRYAKMRNVWFIPSPAAIVKWLKKTGFKNIRVADVTKTDFTEQRSTDWMHFESLPDYLDTSDNSKTVEGDPAPVRAIFIAER